MLAKKPIPFDRRAIDKSVRSEDALTVTLDLENEQVNARANFRSDSMAAEQVNLLRRNSAVQVQLKPAKARNFTPSTGILRRYCGRKSSTEETILQLYHGSISVGKAEEMVALLWGDDTGLGTLTRSAQLVSDRIKAWLHRELAVPQVYVFLQSLEIKQKTKNSGKNSTLRAAVGIDAEGNRQLLALTCTTDSTEDSWDTVFSNLKTRGLRGTKLFIGEIHPTVHKAVSTHFPGAFFQGCLLDFKHEIQRRVETPCLNLVWQALEKIKSSSSEKEAAQIAEEVLRVVRKENRDSVAEIFKNWTATQFSYLHFPRAHWNRLRDVRPFKQVLREFRETIRIIGPILDDDTLMVMAAANFRSVERVKWSNQPFIASGRSTSRFQLDSAKPAVPKLKKAS